jgi:heme/copper-type cytochrome/quinol oxidase subunit 2
LNSVIYIPGTYAFEDIFMHSSNMLKTPFIENYFYFDSILEFSNDNAPLFRAFQVDFFLCESFLYDSNISSAFLDVFYGIYDCNNDSFMLSENEVLENDYDFQQRLLDTDVHLVISSFRTTKLSVNALDVLHSFVILSTGVKVDAIVGRINDMSVFILRDGLFSGQCSELCGSGHFGMPIVVEAINPFDFNAYNEFCF